MNQTELIIRYHSIDRPTLIYAGELPSKVTGVQWALVFSSLGLASLGYLTTDYKVLAFLVIILTALNVVLLTVVAKEALRTRILGKVFLIASTLVFFWIDALDLAHQDPLFAVPRDLPIFADQFSQALLQDAFFYVAMFQLMLLAGYSIRPRLRRLAFWASRRIDSPSYYRQIVQCILVGCALVPFFLSYGLNIEATLEALLASRSASPENIQDIGLLQHLYLLGMYGASIFLVEAFIFRTWKRILAFCLGAISALPYISGGTRHLWLYISLPICIFTFKRFREKLNVWDAMRVAAAVLFVLLIVQLQIILRDVGWAEINKVNMQDVTQTNVTGQFGALLFAEHIVPNDHGFFLEPTEWYFIIHWIPRQLWPDKPVMESWEFYNASYTRGAEFSVTPSVIGQYYINWAFPGVAFIGFWLGFLTYLADRLFQAINLESQRAIGVMIGMFYAFIISSFRFYSPIYFSYFLFAFITMWLLTRRYGKSHETNVSQIANPGLSVVRRDH